MKSKRNFINSKFKLTCLLLFFVSYSLNSLGSQNWVKHASTLRYKNDSQDIVLLRFLKNERPSFQEWQNDVLAFYGLDEKYTLLTTSDQVDLQGIRHIRFSLSYNSYEIQSFYLACHIRNDRVISFNGNIKKLDVQYIQQDQGVSFENALKIAREYMQCDTAMWEIPEAEESFKKEKNDESASYFPKKERSYVLLNKSEEVAKHVLCYKIDIYSQVPFSRNLVFIDCLTGDVVKTIDQISHSDAKGTAKTKFSGIRILNTDSISPNKFRLHDHTRKNGIYTYDLNENSYHYRATDFVDSDNHWANFNSNRDEVAGDIHWGMQTMFDYCLTNFGIEGIKSSSGINSYAHYGKNEETSFFDGRRFYFGDGNFYKKFPRASVDIVAHEYLHGLIYTSSELNDGYEAKTLQESFGDIFAVVAEHHVYADSADWTFAEDLFKGPFRNLSNPSQLNHPVYYEGENWHYTSSNQGGIYINSGVQNYWFHLISEGWKEIDNQGDTVIHTGMGITKAAKIAFQNLYYYLGPNSDFEDAYFYSTDLALTLFGDCSNEYIIVQDAWQKVGLGNGYNPAFQSKFKAEFAVDQQFSCSNKLNVQTRLTNPYITKAKWQVSNGFTSDSLTPKFTINEYGEYSVKLLAESCSGIKDSVFINQYFILDSTLGLCDTIAMRKHPYSSIVREVGCFGRVETEIDSTFGDLERYIDIVPTGVDTVYLTINEFNIGEGDKILVTSKLYATTFRKGDLKRGDQFTFPAPYAKIVFYSKSSKAPKRIEFTWATSSKTNKPKARFSAKDSVIYFGQEVTLTNASYPIGKYHWLLGDGTKYYENDISHTFLKSDTFPVKLVAENCNGIDTSKAVNIVVLPPPKIELSHSQFVDTLVAGSIKSNITTTIRNKGNGPMVYRINHSASKISIDRKTVPLNRTNVLLMTRGSTWEKDTVKNFISRFDSTIIFNEYKGLDPDELSTLLKQNDVVVLPGLLYNWIEARKYWVLEKPLKQYLSEGGNVLFFGCKYDTAIFNTQIINGKKIADIKNVYVDVDTALCFTRNWPKQVIALNHTYSYSLQDADDVATYKGNAVIAETIFKNGKVVLVGHDFQSNDTTWRKVGYDAFRYVSNDFHPHPLVQHQYQEYDTLNPKDSAIIYLNFDASYISGGNYRDVASIESNDTTFPKYPLEFKLNVSDKPVALFETNVSSNSHGLFHFLDKSINNPTSWKWYFGDGDSSTSRNPTHQYAFPGTFTVSLVVKNSHGIDSIILKNLLKHDPIPRDTVLRMPAVEKKMIRTCSGKVQQTLFRSSTTYFYLQDTLVIAPFNCKKLMVKVNSLDLRPDKLRLRIYEGQTTKGKLLFEGANDHDLRDSLNIIFAKEAVTVIYQSDFVQWDREFELEWQVLEEYKLNDIVIHADSVVSFNTPMLFKSINDTFPLNQYIYTWYPGDGDYSIGHNSYTHKFKNKGRHQVFAVGQTCFSADTSNILTIDVGEKPQMSISNLSFNDTLYSNQEVTHNLVVKNNGVGPLIIKNKRLQKTKTDSIKVLYLFDHGYFESKYVTPFRQAIEKQFPNSKSTVLRSLDPAALKLHLKDADVVFCCPMRAYLVTDQYKALLQDYVKNGGGVFSFFHHTLSDLGLIQYDHYQYNISYKASDFNFVINRNHPITANIGSSIFTPSFSVGQRIHYAQGEILCVNSKTTSTQVGTIITKIYGLGKIVYLGGYYYNKQFVDWQTVLANTINWIKYPGMPSNSWISYTSKQNDTLQSGDSVIYKVNVNSNGLEWGDYYRDFVLETNDSSSDEIRIKCSLNVRPKIVSHLSANTSNICDGVVQFTDETINDPTFWNWDFGDGNSSTTQNPTHQYSKYGTYEVTLISGNQLYSDTFVLQKSIVFDPFVNRCDSIEMNSFVTTHLCAGTIYNKGGPDKNLVIGSKDTVVIMPLDGDSISVVFNKLSLPGSTSLSLFDGLPLPQNRVARYTNTNTLPNNGNPILFKSNFITLTNDVVHSSSKSGFEIDWSTKNMDTSLIADFDISNDRPLFNELIHFKDKSKPKPFYNAWDLGDGKIKMDSIFSHRFITSDTLHVKLTARNCSSVDTAAKTIIVQNPPKLVYQPSLIVDTLHPTYQSTVLSTFSNKGNGPLKLKLSNLEGLGLDSLEVLVLTNGVSPNVLKNIQIAHIKTIDKVSFTLTNATDTAILTHAIKNKHILILPYQDKNQSQLFTKFKHIFKNFVSDGGVLLYMGQNSQNTDVINNSGFFKGTYDYNGSPSVTNAINHPILDNLGANSIIRKVHTYSFSNKDLISFQRYKTSDAAAFRKIGKGYVFYIGYEMTVFNYSQGTLLGNLYKWKYNVIDKFDIPAWVNYSDVDTILQPNDSIIFPVSFDATKTFSQYNSYSLKASHNDTSETRPLLIPISLTLTSLTDLSLEEILAIEDECEIDSLPLNFVVSNTGKTTIDSVDISYQINGTTIQSTRIKINLVPFQKDTFTLPNYIHLNSTGEFKIKAWLFHPTDETQENDSNEITLNSFKKPKVEIIKPLNSSACIGDTLTLIVNNPQLSYFWSTSNTDTFLQVYQSGTYNVIGTDMNGCSDTSTAVQYYFTAKPSLNIVADNNGIICSDKPIMIYTNSGYLNYKWSFSQDSSRNQLITNKSGWYHVSAENTYGCAGKSDSLFVRHDTASKNPKVITSLSSPQCNGNSAVASLSQSYSEYKWKTGFTSSSININKSGRYWCAVKSKMGCDYQSDTISFEFIPTPTPKIVSNKGNVICDGDSVTLSTTLNYHSFAWDTGDTTNQITTTSAGSYSVNVSDQFGCNGYSPKFEISKKQNSIPLVILENQKQCEGDTATIKAIFYQEPAYFEWNTGEVDPLIKSTTTGIYSLVVKYHNNCVQRSNIVRTHFNKKPRPTLLNLGQDTFCSGEHTQLTVVPSFYSYLWNTSEKSKSILVDSAGFFNVMVTDSNGCEGTTSTSQIVVHETPSFQIDFEGDTTTCSSDSIQIEASSGPYHYNWGPQFPNSRIVTLKEPGSYHVVATNIFGCQFASGEVRLSHLPNPSADYSYSISSQHLEAKNSSQNHHDYFWVVNEDTMNFNKALNYTFDSSGVYTVGLVAVGECSNDTITRDFDILFLNADQPIIISNFQVYPNPTDGRLNLKLTTDGLHNFSYRITDSRGRVIKLRSLENKRTHLDVSEQLNQLGNGVYWLELFIDGFSFKQTKIVKY